MTPEDREILQLWLDAWDRNDLPLPGDRTYGEVCDLVRLLGLKTPEILARIESGEYVARMRRLTETQGANE